MNDPHLFTAVFTVIYAMIAAIDGLWLHLWRYRLHVHAPAEHAVHTLRSLLFPVIVLLLLMGWATGPWLWCGAAIAAADLLLVARDAAMETRSRDFQRGLPAGEAALHTLLQALHAVVLTCAVAARPWSAWTTTSTIESAPSALAQTIFLVVLSGSIVVAIIHVVLYVRGPRSMPTSRAARLRNGGTPAHVRAATTPVRWPTPLLIWRRRSLQRRRLPGPH